MRLNQAEIMGLIDGLTPYLSRPKGLLFLFGSRVHSEKRGGDIDLLIVVSTPEQVEELVAQKINILCALYEKIGEQKIDLVITDKNKAEHDPFILGIKRAGVLLIKAW